MVKSERLTDLANGFGKKANAARYELKRKNQENKDKNFCPDSHPYDEENTFINTAGRRMCVTCLRNRSVYGFKTDK